MKISVATYIIGYFFFLAFLFHSVVPDAMILSGHLSTKMVKAALEEQEEANTERGAEESKADTRTEYLPGAHASFYIHPAQLFIISDKNIPRNTAALQAVVLPVPTPPPNVTIV